MKLFKSTILLFSMLAILAGCSKSDGKQVRKPSKNIDSTTWIDNLIDGKAAAAKENKKIFLFFSGDDQDSASLQFKDAVFNTSEFISEMTAKYVLVNLDYSNSRIDAAQANPDATDEEKAAATELMVKIEESMKDASRYNLQSTPSFYILSKEGYVITEIIFPEVIADMEGFKAVYETKLEEIAVFENALASARSGKKEDRLAAINKLMEITDPQHRYLLVDVCNDYIKLDKKNETGMVGNFLVLVANANAMEHYLNEEPLKASNEFAKVAESKYLSPSDKQQCYYTAGYLYSISGNDDYDVVHDFLQKAYDADPNTGDGDAILSMMRMMEERYGERSEAEASASTDSPVQE